MAHRLFIGLPADKDPVRISLRETDVFLKSYRKELKTVAPENYHITMKFLGEVNDRIYGDLVAGFSRIDFGIGKISYELKGLGCFPDFSRPSVIWAGISGDLKPVHEIQKIIEHFAASFGFEREKRRFSPHLTLARVRRGVVFDEKLRQYLKDNRETFFASASFDEVVLFESFLSGTGPEYKRLASVPLK